MNGVVGRQQWDDLVQQGRAFMQMFTAKLHGALVNQRFEFGRAFFSTRRLSAIIT